MLLASDRSSSSTCFIGSRCRTFDPTFSVQSLHLQVRMYEVGRKRKGQGDSDDDDDDDGAEDEDEVGL